MNCASHLSMIWYPERDSNSHGTRPTDFKSVASPFPPPGLNVLHSNLYLVPYQLSKVLAILRYLALFQLIC